jgi:uncharacterized membrane protein
MDIIDRKFLALPKEKQAFVFVIVTGFFLVGLTALLSGLTNLVEGLLVIVTGILLGEMIKLHYRIEILEKHK